MRHTIRNHRDFIMADDTPSVKTPLFVIRARPTKFPGDARYGLTVTKKTFKLAVDRNRAKRVLRVWIRENEHLLNPELDYVFFVRSAILGADKPKGIATMATALRDLAQTNE